MQNLQDLQEKIFFECKTILETLSRISSKDELLGKQDLFAEITDRIAFLRILEKNKDSFIAEEVGEKYDDEDVKNFSVNEIMSPDLDMLDDNLISENAIEEEVIFTNELNEIENEEPLVQSTEMVEVPEGNVEEKIEEDMISEIEIEQNYEERVAQKEREFLELEERRRKIVDFKKEDIIHPSKSETLHSETKHEQLHSEKKFKLAHIKGLKVVQNLFDEDPLERLAEEKIQVQESKTESGSILKTNIPTDFMEAEKKKNEFKLDLNDKVAFTKLLFNGDADELKSTVDKLNSYDNLEDAKQFLSEVYYQKDWGKVDEYAQRLWNLVENKFL